MADNTITTELTIDARGVEAGSAAAIRALNAAQAAYDRSIDANRRLQESQDKQVATMVGVETSTRKVAQQWDRLRVSVDPATAANIAYQKSLEQITLVSDRAVSRLGILKEAADKVAASARLAAQQALQAAGAPTGPGVDPNRLLGLTPSPTSARASAEAMQEVFAEQERVAKSAADLRAQINPLNAAFQRMGQQIAENAALQRAGAISTKELAQANALAVDRFNNIERSMKSATTAGRSLSGEVTQLGFQINDVLTGIALGQSPFMILAQQGGQIIQIVAAAKNSIRDMLIGVAKSAWAFLTPIRLVIGGLITIGLTAVTAASSWQSAQRDITLALAGIGRATGASRGDINKIAGAGASIFGFSVSEAREFASTLAATGKIGFDALTPLVRLGHDFAKTFGVDSVEAAKTLATALSDPVRGSAQLNERLGFMDAAMQRNIKNLVEQNRLFEAQQIIVQAIQANVLKASEVTGFWSATWTAIGNAISNAYDKLGQFLSRATSIGLTTEEQLQRAKDRVAELEELSSRRSSAVNKNLGTTAEITRLNQEIDRLTEKLGEAARQAAAVKTNLESLRIGKTVMGFLPEIDNLQNLINQQITVSGAARGDPEILRKLGLTQEQAQRAKAIIDGLVAHFKVSFEQIKTQSGIAFDAITAFSPAQKAMIALRQEEERLRTASDLSPEEKKTAAQLKYNEALHAANTQLSEAARERRLAAEQGVQSTQLEIELVGKNIGEQARLRADLQARHQLEQEAARNRTAFNDAEYAILQKINEEHGKKVQLQTLANLQNQNRLDRDTVFLSPIDQQIASRLQAIHGDKWKEEMNGADAAMMRMTAHMKEFGDIASSAFSQFVNDVLQGKNALDAMLSALGGIGKQLTDIGSKNLMSGAMNMLKGGGLSGFDPVSLASGALGIGISLITSFFDKNKKAADEAKKKLQDAQKQWAEMQDQFQDFISAMKGEDVGSLTSALRSAEKQMRDFVEAAIKAQDFEAAKQAQEAFAKFRDDQIREFKSTWEAMLQAFDLGLGLDNPFVTAAQKVRDLAKQLKGFITDAQTAFLLQPGQGSGGNVNASDLMARGGTASPEEIARANAAVREYLIGLVEGANELSDVQKKLLEIGGTAQALSAMYTDALDEIAEGVTKAITKLRTSFETDLQREINDVSGLGYLNSISDLISKRNTRLADAALIGADTSLVNEAFTKSVQKVIDDAGLVGDKFNDIFGIFPDLTGVIHESTKALQDQINEQKRFQQTIMDFIAQMRGGELSTLSPDKKFAEAQSNYERQIALAQAGDETAKASITSFSQTYLEQARSFLGPSQAYGAIFDRVTAQLMALIDGLSHTMGGGVSASAEGFEQFNQMRLGGIVGGMAYGGMVGGGMWNVDSVRARYAGGGDILLAGGEFVNRAPSVTPQTLPVLDFINRTGSAPSNDNREVVAEMRALRREVAMLRMENSRLVADGNERTSTVAQEVRGLRTDTRQSEGVAKLRAAGK